MGGGQWEGMKGEYVRALILNCLWMSKTEKSSYSAINILVRNTKVNTIIKTLKLLTVTASELCD